MQEYLADLNRAFDRLNMRFCTGSTVADTLLNMKSPGRIYLKLFVEARKAREAKHCPQLPDRLPTKREARVDFRYGKAHFDK